MAKLLPKESTGTILAIEQLLGMNAEQQDAHQQTVLEDCGETAWPSLPEQFGHGSMGALSN